MKILHVIDSEGFYGAEAVLINLVAGQNKLGLQATILNMRPCDSSEQSLESEASKNGFDFVVIHIKAGLDILGSLKIIRYAKNKHYDIIHCHGYKPNILLGLMPKIGKTLPIVTTLHGWTNTKKYTKLWIYEQLDALSLKFIDSIIAVSKGMKLHPKLKYNKRLLVVPNGISRINLSESAIDMNTAVKSFCSDEFVVGAIGRLSKEKGFNYLIESLHILNKNGIRARLIIIGEGRERQYLESLIKKYHLKDKVLMPGYLREATRYLPLFDVFVLSSLTEGLPIVLLEAMQARLPIVATRVGGIPEVLQEGDAGILVDPCSVRDLVKGIELSFFDKSLVNRRTSLAHKLSMTVYSSEKMSSNYLFIYNKVIKSFFIKRKNRKAWYPKTF